MHVLWTVKPALLDWRVCKVWGCIKSVSYLHLYISQLISSCKPIKNKRTEYLSNRQQLFWIPFDRQKVNVKGKCCAWWEGLSRQFEIKRLQGNILKKLMLLISFHILITGGCTKSNEETNFQSLESGALLGFVRYKGARAASLVSNRLFLSQRESLH